MNVAKNKGQKGLHIHMIYTDCYIGGNGLRFGGHVPFFFGFRLFAFSNVFLIIIRKKLIIMLAEKGQACVSHLPYMYLSSSFGEKTLKRKKKGFQFLCTVQPAYALPYILSPPPRLVRTSCTLRGVLGHKGSTAYSYIGQLTSYILR